MIRGKMRKKGYGGSKFSYMWKKKEPLVKRSILSLDKRIKKINSAEEIKYIDFLQGTTNIPGSGGSPQGLTMLLNEAVTGDLPVNNREGGEIRTTSVQIRMHIITGNTSGTDFPTEFRVMLFWDRQPNVGGPTLYTSGTGSGTMGLIDNTTITPIIHAPLNHQARSRYRVLMDNIFVLNSTGGTTNMPIARWFTIRRRLGRKVIYTKGAGAGTNEDLP